MEQRPPTMPKLAWVNEEEEGPGAAPAQQPAEVEQAQPLQEDAAVDRTQEQDPTRAASAEQRRYLQPSPPGLGLLSLLSRALCLEHPMEHPSPLALLLQMVCNSSGAFGRKRPASWALGSLPYSEVFTYETSAALLDLLVKQGTSTDWLVANEPAEHRLDNTLLELTAAQPADVVMTLLRVAPLCDRAAATMWTTIMSSPRTAELAQLLLLDVLGSWPEHSMRTSDGDDTDVFALAATVVMWKILQVPCVPHVLIFFFPRLFAHLLFQVYFSTLHTPEEVNTFWKGCQEEHGLATNPSRFAVRTLKALLCLLQCEHVVMAMERKRGWDTLLCADTHHYAVGLLAREMSQASLHLCKSILCCLLEMLSKEMPYWDFPALAFLVEVSPTASAASLELPPSSLPSRSRSCLGRCPRPVLECLDLSDCGDSILEMMSRYLQSECREKCHLALRSLMMLSKDPSMVM
ncbi:uncharacterized protein LOC120410317 [Corvus cornix cornix]|uniref:uncharacterized protein LOC120410317 n=1 Tax=Corvus cornix cornix TaxID=932674 RepID=UPI00194E5E46|nr:uncharacterized protein LOC120410317 [Corvus cornix cornix]